GVGTQDPKSELEVRGNAKGKLAGTLSVTNIAGSGASTSIDFRTYDTGTSAPNVRLKATDLNWSSRLEFQTKNPGNKNNPLTTRMTILPGGHIGVGTTSPGTPLHIASAQDSLLRLQTLDNKWLFTEWYDKDNKRRTWMGLDSNLGKFWIAPENGTKEVVINSLLRVKANLEYEGQLGKLDTLQQGGATIRAHDLSFGHTARRGSPGRAMVDNKTELVMNYGSDWSGGTRIDGKLKVTNNLTVSRDLTVERNQTVKGSSTVNNNLTVAKDLTVNDDATIKDYLTVGTEIRGKIWRTNFYTVTANKSKQEFRVKMGPSATTVAFLTHIQGNFAGTGEWATIKSIGGYWYLCAYTWKPNLIAKAMCIGKPF
ncbi:MAG TPA: hypothetical protein DCP28_10530, partial [Cytophagales bacterium]|nr:hypothetical protein [Cytophagales bacterium]